jgi:hypothetical protein
MQPLFELGSLLITPGAVEILLDQAVLPSDLLDRHVQGDWAEMEPQDEEANRLALVDGSRIFSCFTLSGGLRIWIITEAVGEAGCRASTCILLPSEY